MKSLVIEKREKNGREVFVVQGSDDVINGHLDNALESYIKLLKMREYLAGKANEESLKIKNQKVICPYILLGILFGGLCIFGALVVIYAK